MAEQVLGWKASVGLEEGLSRTVAYFEDALARDGRP
jgi:nucleoside-diphosphate-sugar epimerase